MRAPNRRTVQAILAMVAGVLLLGGIFLGWRKVDPTWAIVSFLLVYDFDARTAWRVALQRMLYTVIGCALALVAMMVFGLHWLLLPAVVGVAVALCGWGLQFRGPWRALLICVVLVIGSSLGDPSHEIGFAVTRALQVLAGSVTAVFLSLPAIGIEGKDRE